MLMLRGLTLWSTTLVFLAVMTGCTSVGTLQTTTPGASESSEESETNLAGQSTNCSSAYPDVCIPSAPPDIDCGEIPHQDFQVLSPDPHRFDRDKDGIGCES